MEQFRTNLNTLVDLACDDLNDLWSGVDTSEAFAVRAFLERVMPDLIETYGSTAALLAADYYDETTNMFGNARPAVLDDSITAGQVQASSRWAIDPLFGESDPAQAWANIQQVVDRLVKQTARNTIHQACERDGVAYARVPSGSETCAFCLMLASRGAVYWSEESAGGDGNKYHGQCDCVPTPMMPGDEYPDGYDPDSMYDMYLAVHESGMTGAEAAAAMRRAYGLR